VVRAISRLWSRKRRTPARDDDIGPVRANAFAIARPSPRLPPVISVVLPERSNIGSVNGHPSGSDQRHGLAEQVRRRGPWS